MEVVVERADLDPEELDGVARALAREARRLVDPRVVLLRAVEEVAPEGLLVVPAQAAFVGVAVTGGETAVEESLVAGGRGAQRQGSGSQGGEGARKGQTCRLPMHSRKTRSVEA